MTNANDIMYHTYRAVAWAVGSLFSLGASFVERSLPLLQWAGCVTAIVAGYFSIRASRAAIRKAKERE